MIEIVVKDVRGAAHAALSISPIALLCGLNGQGKSSTLEAVAYTVAGKPIPPGVTKGMASLIVNDAAKLATCTVSGPEGSVRMAWPKCETASTGTKPPRSSEIAAGLIDLCRMTPEKRSLALMPIMGATPTPEDLRFALAGTDASEDDIKYALNFISDKIEGMSISNAWDACATQIQQNGGRVRASWEAATGEKWGGAAKARDWWPEGWSAALERAPPESLQAAIDDADAAYKAAANDEAIRMFSWDTLRKEIAAAGDVDAAFEAASANLDSALKAEAAARGKLGSVPAPVEPGDMATCPCCGKAVEVRQTLAGYELAEKEVSPPEAITAYRAIMDGIARAEQQGNTARTAKAAYDAKAKADKHHADIMSKLAVLSALKPEGVRARKLAEAREAFNDAILAPLCEAAGWEPVSLGPDLGILCGGRPYSLLSHSEKWRATVIMQCAVAQREGADLLIIDGCDVLMQRGGLVKLLKMVGIPALLGMSLKSRSEAVEWQQKTARFGISVYWIENGQAGPAIEEG